MDLVSYTGTIKCGKLSDYPGKNFRGQKICNDGKICNASNIRKTGTTTFYFYR